ncbi:MAG: NAD(P)-dependent oxidoreductase [Syntrophobacterales bacterium]|nr:NAD(P)-dependent oxidoreductase [Syntrophobacterales bacterium]
MAETRTDSFDSKTIAFIGLGNMGAPMAERLLMAGHRLRVYARRQEAAAPLAALGATVVASPAVASRGADFVCVMVTNTSDVEAVLLGPNGAIEGAIPGALCIVFSTISAVAARNIALSLAEKGIAFIDAPVSGGVRAAREGSLAIMVGGEPEALEKARPLLELLGKAITHVGPAGSGQLAKACNQIVQVVNIQGIAEAMHFAREKGGDLEKILAAIAPGFAGSRMLDMMGPKMAKRDFSAGIEARLHEKDFRIVKEIADDAGIDLPVVTLVARQLRVLMEKGWGYDDTSSLLRVLEA